MIDKISLKFGKLVTSDPLEFFTGSTTIFVGPNNSGKSLILREIESYCNRGRLTDPKIINEIHFDFPKADKVRELLLQRKIDPLPENYPLSEGHDLISDLNIIKGRGGGELQVNINHLIGWMQEGSPQIKSIAQYFIRLFTIRLDGKTRFDLIAPVSPGDLQKPPANHLTALFQDDKTREKIREITKEAFGLYFTIDPTGMARFRIRLSKKIPEDYQEEQSLDARSRAFHRKATDISEFGDGVKAYIGLICAVLCQDFRIMLIDEPEAFLYPPLVRKLGMHLSNLAAEREGHVFASTHSADFVMGCIQSGQKVNIIRLTYDKENATARLLQADKLSTMMKHPLRRSINVLSALFYHGAIICESDSDRVFYQEINERLLANDLSGIDNCLFLNAQNKQTVGKIAGPLREIGIPAAVIVDLDIIKNNNLSDLLKSIHVPQTLINAWGNLRGEINGIYKSKKLDPKRVGLDKLNQKEKDSVVTFIDDLARFGLFVVPCGELERWLLDTDTKGHGATWLMNIFEKIGSDPSDSKYLKPSQGDVWDFIRNIKKWMIDPLRKGNP